ncbi:hypothetical protein PHAVU_010G067500 [Phaseolus vulgaris]
MGETRVGQTLQLIQRHKRTTSQWPSESAREEGEAPLSARRARLEIMEALLKACNSMDQLAKKCKRMVFEYGPLIIVKAEKYLKTTDICTALHVCPASTAVSNNEASIMEEVPLISDS